MEINMRNSQIQGNFPFNYFWIMILSLMLLVANIISDKYTGEGLPDIGITIFDFDFDFE